MRKDLDCELFYSKLKLSQRLIYYIYYLATDNIYIVLENDNTVLIKVSKKVVKMLNSQETRIL